MIGVDRLSLRCLGFLDFIIFCNCYNLVETYFMFSFVCSYALYVILCIFFSFKIFFSIKLIRVLCFFLQILGNPG